MNEQAQKRIHVLDKKVAELIAAGEVVERPASAVKELLENSIDAGATMITLEIKNGGITYIRITDNGCGIMRDDVKNAFVRHATSKITTQEDLTKIGTLGFRGEALASISAVSKTELLTRTQTELAGTHLVLEGGETVSLEDAGCPRGTTIIVRELFYNTPARMKFLKKDTTEANAVLAVAQRIALSHPEISLRFIKDGREDIHTPGDSKLLSAIHSVLGKDFAKNLFEVSYTYSHINVTGYSCKPIGARANRNMQFFFLNGRLVKSKTMMAAVETAYRNNIMVGKYPGCVIEVELNPQLVDVNVHPAKLEVRFSNEKEIFDSIYYAVKSSLSKADERPEFDLPINKSEKNFVEPKKNIDNPTSNNSNFIEKSKPFEFKNENQIKQEEQLTIILSKTPTITESEPTFTVNNSTEVAYTPYSGGKIDIDFENPVKDNTSSNNQCNEVIPLPTDEDAPKEDIPLKTEEINEIKREETEVFKELPSIKVVGECFSTYIIAEMDKSLYIIDKHAAHERILYEKIKSTKTNDSQMLLEPVSIKLSADEYSVILENKDILEQAGIIADDFGNSTIIVRSSPLDLVSQDVKELIAEIAGLLLDHKKDIIVQKLDWIFHSVACRAAIKANDKTTEKEMQILAQKILLSKDIMYCPHGRPVAFEIKKSTLEKNFGR